MFAPCKLDIPSWSKKVSKKNRTQRSTQRVDFYPLVSNVLVQQKRDSQTCYPFSCDFQSLDSIARSKLVVTKFLHQLHLFQLMFTQLVVKELEIQNYLAL